MSTGVEANLLKRIGNTPLIRLDRFSDETGCDILGKAEYLNPGGSIKDRTALSIITDAEERGWLKPGDTIVEGTAGNTGIGLTVIGQAKGYRTVIVIPETQSPEKIGVLRARGATVITVPERPDHDPENYNRVARRLAEERGWFWANQFDNTANRRAHYQSTGPEIWEQTGGRVTGFVAAVGTGGTLAGTSAYLKEKNASVDIVCVDSHAGLMWSWFSRGTLAATEEDSEIEGVGQTRVTRNLQGVLVDRAYRIPDREALSLIFRLRREQGLFVGLSASLNLAGALRLAREGGRGQTIVVPLCDAGERYRSKLENRAWLAAHHFAAEATPEIPAAA